MAKIEATQPQGVTQIKPKTSKLGFLKNRGKWTLPIALVLLVLLGGGAAAYYGVVVPNKPENVLKTAVEKQLQKQQTTAKGSLSVDLKDEKSSIKNVTVNFTSAVDMPKQAFSVQLEAAVSGAKLPVEMRGLDKSLYFKVGDLGSIKGLAALAGGKEASEIVDTVGSKLSNQWIEIDESLLKQANAECTTGLLSSFSQKDIDELMKVYGENTFIAVTSKSTDKIDGKDATKYNLSIDKQKAMDFADKLGSVEALKKINECSKSTANQVGGDQEVKNQVEDATKDTDISFAVWIDGNKNLRQIELKAADKEASGTFTLTYTDEKVDIQKPTGAKPLLEVFGDFSQLFGGGSDVDQLLGGSSGDSALDSMSDSCKTAYQQYILTQGASALPADCL